MATRIQQTFHEFQDVFTHLNSALFGNKLPERLISERRKSRSPRRWKPSIERLEDRTVLAAVLDTVIAASLDAPGEVDSYPFDGNAGQRVTISAYFGSSAPGSNEGGVHGYSQFQLISPHGTVLVTQQPRFPTTTIQSTKLDNFPLPADGIYVVEVSNIQGRTGNYWLGISDPQVQFIPLSLTDVTESEFGVRGDIHGWEFDAVASQTVGWSYQGSAAMGNWSITDSTGSEVASGSGGRSVVITVTPESSGVHQLVFDGRNSLLLSRSDIGPFPYVLLPAVTAPLDQVIAESITTSQPADLYLFDGMAGQSVTISAYFGSSAPGSNEGGVHAHSQFQLISPDGTVLATQQPRFPTTTIQFTTLDNFVLPASGTYAVSVLNTQRRTGNYWLGISDPSVQFLPLSTTEVTNALFGVRGDIHGWEFDAVGGQTLGWTYQGEISIGGWSIVDASGMEVASGGGGSSVTISFTPASSEVHRLLFRGTRSSTLQSPADVGPFGYQLIAAESNVPPNEPPVANAGGSYTVDEGSTVILSGADSFDPDGSIVAYEWDLSYEEASGFQVDGTGETLPVDATDGPETVTIALRVRDDHGELSHIDTASVSIFNVVPTIIDIQSDGPVIAGSPVTISVTATDPAGANDSLFYSFDFDNDGLFEVLNSPSSMAQHTFSSGGVHTVQVCVQDDDLGSSCTALTTVSPETQSTPFLRSATPPFTNSTYDLALVNDTLLIDLDIHLIGTDPASLTAAWESGIENVWNNKAVVCDGTIVSGDCTGEQFPIVLDVEFVNSDWDVEVTVHSGDGCVDMLNWYTGDPSGWGLENQGLVAAHEAGHMIGLYDEYVGGRTDPVNPITNDTTSIMHTPLGAPKVRHYQHILNWINGELSRNMVLGQSPLFDAGDEGPPLSEGLPPTLVDVTIDVRPGSDANSINLASNGQIAVAIFTTDEFDASQIVVSTVEFAGASTVHSALDDVDGDGDLDIVLHFKTQDTNLRVIYEQLLLDNENADRSTRHGLFDR